MASYPSSPRGASGPLCAISKVPTGIVDLDDVLNGGVPEGGITLLIEGPGTGKTILGLEFLVKGARAGKPGILLTLEERNDALRCYARAFGPGLEDLVEQVTTRRLRVTKYRGSSFGRNEYPFGMTDKDVWIIPVTQASLLHRALGESISTGVKGLDSVLGGTGFVHGKPRNQDRYRREPGVLKSRGQSHSDLIHEFRIMESGIRISGKEGADG